MARANCYVLLTILFHAPHILQTQCKSLIRQFERHDYLAGEHVDRPRVWRVHIEPNAG